MADGTVSCPAGEYTKVVDNVTTNISIEVLGDIGVELIATAADSQPSAATKGFTLPWQGNGWSQATLEEMFPGVATAAYLWAQPIGVSGNGNAKAQVRVSHA